MGEYNLDNLLSEIKQNFEKAKSGTFSFLLTGRVGVGKSSTINSLIGQPVAPVDHYKPGTFTVAPYHFTINGVKGILIDTPGLCEALEEEEDLKYLRMISTNIKEVDSLWFVTRLDDPRLGSDEKRAIRIISHALGKEVWENAVIVFTHANSVEASRYLEALTIRTQLVKEEIAKYNGKDISDNLPSIAVDNTGDTTPDGQTWINKLYFTVYHRISSRGFAPFFVASAPMLQMPDDDLLVRPKSRPPSQ